MGLRNFSRIPEGGGISTVLIRNGECLQPWVEKALLSGVTAGASAYSDILDVHGRNVFVFQLSGNITGMTLAVEATIDEKPDTATWVALTPAITAVGFLTLTGNYTYLRLHFTAITGANPTVNILAVRG